MSKPTVFQMNDYEWYLAEDELSAIKEFCEMNGCTVDEAANEYDLDPRPLTEGELDKYTVDLGNGIKMTFRDMLEDLVRTGEKLPCFFATTEY